MTIPLDTERYTKRTARDYGRDLEEAAGDRIVTAGWLISTADAQVTGSRNGFRQSNIGLWGGGLSWCCLKKQHCCSAQTALCSHTPKNHKQLLPVTLATAPRHFLRFNKSNEGKERVASELYFQTAAVTRGQRGHVGTGTICVCVCEGVSEIPIVSRKISDRDRNMRGGKVATIRLDERRDTRGHGGTSTGSQTQLPPRKHGLTLCPGPLLPALSKSSCRSLRPTPARFCCSLSRSHFHPSLRLHPSAPFVSLLFFSRGRLGISGN